MTSTLAKRLAFPTSCNAWISDARPGLYPSMADIPPVDAAFGEAAQWLLAHTRDRSVAVFDEHVDLDVLYIKQPPPANLRYVLRLQGDDVRTYDSYFVAQTAMDMVRERDDGVPEDLRLATTAWALASWFSLEEVPEFPDMAAMCESG